MINDMTWEDLNREYDKLQKKYGDKNLNSIYNGGKKEDPKVMFVFMNPTKRNIAANKDWIGPKYPWIGTKNVWTLFYKLGLIDDEIFSKIRSIKGSEWTSDFAELVYDNVRKNDYFITNLGKCTQLDARSLKDAVLKRYLLLLEREIELADPKAVILFGNQVSSIVLNEKISVSNVRKKVFEKKINSKIYKCYPVFYPVGNGTFNIDKAIEDIRFIIDNI